MTEKPIVVTMIGDPCGIGPEVCVKALASHKPYAMSRPVLLGSAAAVRQAVDISGLHLDVHPIRTIAEATHQPGVADVIDTEPLASEDVAPGTPTPTTGAAMVRWMEEADELASSGAVSGWIMAPISTEGLKLAELAESIDDLQPEGTFLFRMGGTLRNISLTEHIPISAVPATVTKEAILDMLDLIDGALRTWGVPRPRYGVVALNPHAKGEEETAEIVPAVQAAAAKGFDVVGPISPDSAFRQCVEGRFDVALSMYHDQGQIALKTAAFVGACTIYLGLPYLRMTIPHGTAFDIAGRGIARPESMIAAMEAAGSLASGRGFPSFASS